MVSHSAYNHSQLHSALFNGPSRSAPIWARSSSKPSKATSRDTERDVLVLMMGIHMGVRVSEMTQVEVGNFMFSSGRLRQEVSLRAARNSFNKMDSELPLRLSANGPLSDVHFV